MVGNMLKRLKIATRNKLRVFLGYDAELLRLQQAQRALDHLVRERTDVHADVDLRGRSQVVLIGRYRGTDYVEIRPVAHEDLARLVDYLNTITPHARLGRVDVAQPYRAVVANHINRSF
ncbi:hypothetical protein [Azohydromonas lata]|uniref:Uncharacterized protein n=1 Tax=Azohydromonas lata TaxID=45677 RepID=A0ABU5IDS0_9BURK|nr:hypothetical protein [Azohydromonas lata]MDZ5456969.1 hypothetical protein [Azohydromonas lata]